MWSATDILSDSLWLRVRLSESAVTTPTLFSHVLRRCRIEAGLTQEELAARAKMSVRALSDLERGVNRTPRRQSAQLLADALGLTGTDRERFEESARGREQPVAPVSGAEPAIAGAPLPRTSFVGRTDDIALALRTLAEARVLTLTGPGGVGKTRLALTIGARSLTDYPDGVHLVALTAVRAPELVAEQIAKDLGIRPEPGQAPADAVGDALRDRRTLLVLDNMEHLLDSVPMLNDLMSGCPQLSLLITSREPTGLGGERCQPVPPLAVPAARDLDLDTARHVPSIALFVQRAELSDRNFALTAANVGVVADVCRRLDGLPLAIELAASRVGLLSVTAIRDRLQKRLQTLPAGPDALARTRTMDECIGWSYDLLPEADRQLFRALTLFPGGCTIAAATAVGGLPEDLVLDGLDALVRRSLLVTDVDPDGGPRLSMLETIREYGLRRLAASGEGAALERAQTDYYVRLCEEAEPELVGPEQSRWQDLMEREHDNLRTVLSRVAEEPSGVRICGAVWRFWYGRGYHAEGLRWLDRALDGSGTPDPRHRARALNGAGALGLMQGSAHLAEARFQEAISIWDTLNEPAEAAAPLTNLAMLAHYGGDPLLGRERYGVALARARAAGNHRGTANVLVNLGTLDTAEGRYAEALATLEEASALFRKVADRQSEATALGALALVHVAQGHYQHARVIGEHVLTIFRELSHHSGEAEALLALARVELWQGDRAATETRLTEALSISERLRDPWGTGSALLGLARLTLLFGGDRDQAARRAEEALRLSIRTSDPSGRAATLAILGGLAASAALTSGGSTAGSAEPAQAMSYWREGLSIALPIRDSGVLVELLELGAFLHATAGDGSLAARLLGVAGTLPATSRTDAERRFADAARASSERGLGTDGFAAAYATGEATGIDGLAELLGNGFVDRSEVDRSEQA
jgi:predicted ATPase/Tfp pilus assembly protein PilF